MKSTWSQVFSVCDQVLHALHHFCYCQVFQDAFTDTDDLTYLKGKVLCWTAVSCLKQYCDVKLYIMEFNGFLKTYLVRNLIGQKVLLHFL